MGTKSKIIVIGGDGIGPQVIDSTTQVLEAVAPGQFEFDHHDLGVARWQQDGTTMPPELLERIQAGEFAAGLLGAVGLRGVKSPAPRVLLLDTFRFGLQLYQIRRPVKLLDPRLCMVRGVDEVNFTVLREGTEGCYVGMAGTVHRGTPLTTAIETVIATRTGCYRIIKDAFDYAVATGRSKVCLVHKSNAMEHTGGLWREVFSQISADYPAIEARYEHCDIFNVKMMDNPSQFEVVVTENLMGDSMTDLAAWLIGGMGVAASANINPGTGQFARFGLFEPTHGSAQELVGLNTANPMAAIQSGAMMLEFLDMHAEAQRVLNAVQRCISENLVTAELSNRMARHLDSQVHSDSRLCTPRSCSQVTAAIIERL